MTHLFIDAREAIGAQAIVVHRFDQVEHRLLTLSIWIIRYHSISYFGS